mmetsp:Transcript_1233/g.2130  ORF Transcript_1233/g.2130 Transcript_1233/m.2130 type:complete len:786 (-) Transcript_1233:229-2586(-)
MATNEPRFSDAVSEFCFWAPDATHVWWAPRGDRDHLSPMRASPDAAGYWKFETKAPCRQGDEYAFLVQSVQDVHHSGFMSRFFKPGHSGQHEIEAIAEKDEQNKCEGALDHQDEDTCECASSSRHAYAQSASGGQTKSYPDLIGEADFLICAAELADWVAEAEGVRVTFCSQRVEVLGVEAIAPDGSWGPIAFHSIPHDTDALPMWIADLVDCTASDACHVVFRVTRIDWRIDPRSLVLTWDRAASTQSALAASPDASSALVRSVVCRRPISPPAFHRCCDRALAIYEMHIGSFTAEGTLRAAASKLDHIQKLGCSMLSVMPVQQDICRLKGASCWGYDPLSLFAVDSGYGTPEDLRFFIDEAHRQGFAVIIDFVANHVHWDAQEAMGAPYFITGTSTPWGPRLDFKKQEVRSYIIDAVELLCINFGFDGVRVDSTKSIRKFPDGSIDPFGALLLGEVTAWCRANGKLSVAEDLEDGEGVLQMGGLGFHLQWDMAHFCWVYDALVNPDDQFRDMYQVAKGLAGLAPSRGHPLRGRVVFMESHDTAPSDRYGRLPAAVFNGKAFIASMGDSAEADGFQRVGGEVYAHPDPDDVVSDAFSWRRAALGMLLLFTSPGVPMILQGQETFDCRPFRWPTGPGFQWNYMEERSGPRLSFYTLTKHLLQLRVGSSVESLGPLAGDGLYVFHSHNGVIAYLRWNEYDSSSSAHELALIVINCTHDTFSSYELGVPPSKTWEYVFSTDAHAACCELPIVGTHVSVTEGSPKHAFPSTVALALPSYSGVVLYRSS